LARVLLRVTWGNLLSADPLAAVEIAAALLEQHPDPVIRAIGAWLAAYPAPISVAVQVTGLATQQIVPADR
jgi:hypothetical protein